MSQFRIAIVGTGLIAQDAHIPSVLANPETELVGLVDLAVERAAELAKAYGLDVVISSSLDSLLDRAERRDDDHHGVLIDLTGPAQHLQAVLFGHSIVGDDQIERLLVELFERFPSRGRGNNLVAVVREGGEDPLTNR